MEVVITGISLISALGENLNINWSNILQGKTAIRIEQPFADLPPLPLAKISEKQANLSDLITKLINDVLEDAKLTTPLLDCDVIIGSSRSFQYVWENIAIDYIKNKKIDKINFLETLPNTPAIISAKIIGTQSIVSTYQGACATGIIALAQGFDLIKWGKSQRVIVGVMETAITPLTITGFKQMGAIASSGCYPFDLNREGLVLGEGGAFFVLESAHLARERKAKIYGKISGYGLTNDACYMYAPSPDQKSAITAIKDCLYRSNLYPENIDYIHSHGTGTKLNDQYEVRLIEKLFKPNIPISSTKGATGHTLGASGGLGVAFCLMALQSNIIPPCVGLKQPEYPLNFIIKAQEKELKNILCLSFGFGGQNAAIALSK